MKLDMMLNPTKMVAIVNSLPSEVWGEKSPYPTVVNVIMIEPQVYVLGKNLTVATGFDVYGMRIVIRPLCKQRPNLIKCS